jgi:hypothetical protein
MSDWEWCRIHKHKYYGHVSQEAVRRYINEQQGKDVFEYSIFGNNEVKIGNFTHSKLSGWSQ